MTRILLTLAFAASAAVPALSCEFQRTAKERDNTVVASAATALPQSTPATADAAEAPVIDETGAAAAAE